MLDSLIPPPLFQMALAACLMLPVFLIAISWLAPRNLPAKTRLAAAIVVSPLVAIAGGLHLLPEPGSNPPLEWIDTCCAGLLYATAIMIVYSAWSLIGYGFTVSILLDVERAGTAVSRTQLIQSFAGGNGLSAFVHDRSALLLRMRLMEVSENWYRISGYRALLFARTVKLAMDLYAIRRRELN